MLGVQGGVFSFLSLFLLLFLLFFFNEEITRHVFG